MKNEQGRSLTEMLGMLAVIGILSVTGVTLYRKAINTHQANELINEANKRAIVIASQIMSGRQSLSIAEFNNNTPYGTFGNPLFGQEQKTFSLSLTNVPFDVCLQMKRTVGNNGTMQIIGNCGEELSLIFNKDLKAGVTALTPDGWTSSDPSECPPENGYGTECRVCINTEYMNSDAVCKMQYPTQSRVCIDGTCQAKDEGDGCLYNSDCKNKIADDGATNCGTNDCFCNYNGNVDQKTGPAGHVGVCSVKADKKGTFPQNVEAQGYICSSYWEKMDYFTAQNFCHSFGKKMVSLKDLKITFSLAGGCHNDGNEAYICNISDEDWQALTNKFNTPRFYPWLKDVVPGQSRAYATNLSLDYPHVYIYNRDGGRYAFCK